jgi:hypothetical protein
MISDGSSLIVIEIDHLLHYTNHYCAQAVVQFHLDYCAIVVFPTDSPVGVTCPKEQMLGGAPGLVEMHCTLDFTIYDS